MPKRIAPVWLAAAICVGLAGCSGAGLAPGGTPNLVLARASVSDDGPAAEAAFTLSAVVRNAGRKASAATELHFYRSMDETITPDDNAVGTTAVPALAASARSSRSLDLTAPSTPGTYYYGACVEPVAGESATANNCSPSVRTVTEPQRAPNLVVVAYVSDGSPAAGATFTLSATVRNAGDEASAATTLRFYRSADDTITTADTELDTTEVAALAASGGSSKSLPVTAPPTPGTYYYGACADPVAGESATADNCSAAVTVRVPEPDRGQAAPQVSDSTPAEATAPDLNPYSTEVTTGPDDVTPGTPFSLSVSVRNDGNGSAAATKVRFYQSTDATITTDDTVVATDDVPELAPSATSTHSARLTAPSTPGTYYYGTCLDAVVNESNPTNDCANGIRLLVRERLPDLALDSLSLSDDDPEPGAGFVLSITVRNTGDAAAATTLRFYQSTDATITTDDTVVATDDVPELAPSATSTHSARLTAPSTPGTYYYGTCLDAVTNDSNTTNDCSSAMSVRVRERRPELQLPGVTLSANDLRPGETFVLGLRVVNRGDEVSAATTLRYYRSPDRGIWISDTPVGTAELGSVAPSETIRESMSLQAHSTPGSYYYGACVEMAPGAADTKISCSGGIRVRVPEQRPNLDVWAPDLNPRTVEPGARFALWVYVMNIGNVTTATTTLRFYRSMDETITTDDTEVGSAELEALAASQRSPKKSISLTAPSTAGTYYYGACVDAVAGDADTTNDCSKSRGKGWGRLRVAVVRPSDLTVGATWIGPGPFVLTDYLTAVVTNNGPEVSFPTTLRYYQSTDSSISADDDTEVSSVRVPAVEPSSATGPLKARVTLPSRRGTYYYGACVDTAPGETNTSNNCGSAATIVISPPPPPPPIPEPHCNSADPNEIWCATLIVGGTGGESYGYNFLVNSGTLTPSAFTYRGVTMSVRALEHVKNRHRVKFWLDRDSGPLPADGLFGDKSFTLELAYGTVTKRYHVATNRSHSTYYNYYDKYLGWCCDNPVVAVTLRLNPAPTAADGTVTTPADTDYTFDSTDFNFMDRYGDTLRSVKIDSLPARGTLKLGNANVTAGSRVTATQLRDDNLTYTPPAGQTGNAFTTFNFKVNDRISDSASYTMTIDVTP